MAILMFYQVNSRLIAFLNFIYVSIQPYNTFVVTACLKIINLFFSFVPKCFIIFMFYIFHMISICLRLCSQCEALCL
jgi:hypothetical protein